MSRKWSIDRSQFKNIKKYIKYEKESEIVIALFPLKKINS